jgi:hypothetical protein
LFYAVKFVVLCYQYAVICLVFSDYCLDFTFFGHQNYC